MTGPTAFVGPVLINAAPGRAVVAAIRRLNPNATVMDRGAYLRVLVEERCIVTREAVEAELGAPFGFPGDLEPLMPSFKGRMTIAEELVEWRCGS